jgi:16S rRNA (cytosine1402-N4)-methyltransferase
MKTHITVLRDEAVDALAIKKKSIVVDATLGSCGHARTILSKLGPQGTFVGIDADPLATTHAQKTLGDQKCTIHLCVDNFRNIDSILETLQILHIDAIIADLGWRMEQFSGNGKGFSFQVTEPLIMTYGDPAKYPFTARDIVNDWKVEDISNVLKAYGEEKYAWRIAQGIVAQREVTPIESTEQLVEVINTAVPAYYRHGRIHPATRTFQALRIAVNDEFDALETFIKKSVTALNTEGRIAIITFHSIEDRIVKHLFKQLAHDHIGLVCTKKPICPQEEEVKNNPRSRSAKLRVFQKL